MSSNTPCHWFCVFSLCCINLQTTSVHALARQLLGSAYSNGVLELNASDSRGIDVSGSIKNIRVACVFLQYISYRTLCAHFYHHHYYTTFCKKLGC